MSQSPSPPPVPDRDGSDLPSPGLENFGPDRSNLEAYLFLIATTLCWAANAVAGRLAVGEVSPMLVVLGRWTGVMLLCFVFLRPRIKEDWPVLKRHLPFLAALGTLGYTGFNALFYVAAHSTTAINIGILQGSTPIFVLVGTILFYRMPVGPLQAVGVVITLSGVTLVAAQGSWDRLTSLAFNQGDLLMLLASLLYAAYTLALRKRPAISPLSTFAVMAASAFVVSLPIAGMEALSGYSQMPTAKGWIIVALIALFPSFIGQILFIQGVDKIGPGRAGVFMNLVPVFAAVMAVIVLGEQFHLYHALALVLVLGGIYLSERYKRL
ncbi:DMT family transporter [Rhodospirillaceae bacterium KN72]|uniref:DMT family transporter n=1 Tax=Pacificispira spongiicola TaxID=2729598 RepID=A0A7Y0DWN8_9PROT|nr:DMT family transporter [Pacificispira spongiicola]NMM42979.1 DMT family transporter [Pacificispira spongiicola]